MGEARRNDGPRDARDAQKSALVHPQGCDTQIPTRLLACERPAVMLTTGCSDSIPCSSTVATRVPTATAAAWTKPAWVLIRCSWLRSTDLPQGARSLVDRNHRILTGAYAVTKRVTSHCAK